MSKSLSRRGEDLARESDTRVDRAVRSLPGFYYDPVKKKYFKISQDRPPPCPTLNGSEELLASASMQRNTALNPGKINNYVNVCKLTCKRACAELLPRRFSDSVRQYLIGTLSDKGGYRSTAVVSSYDYSPASPEEASFCEESATSYVSTLRASSCGGYLAALARPFGCERDLLRVYAVNRDLRFRVKPLSLTPVSQSRLHNGSKVISWSPHLESADKLLVGSSGDSSCMLCAFAVSLDSSDARDVLDYVVLPEQISCLSWNCNPLRRNMFSISWQCGVRFIDINRMQDRSQTVRTHALPQAMAFAKTSDTVLVGCKSGHIQVLDVREKKPVGKLRPASQYCIDCLKLLNDENLVAVSNWQGDITLYDLRSCGRLVYYRGHKNNHRKLEFCLDSVQRNLFAVGSDGCLRVWDVRLGRLLSSIPKRSCLEPGISPAIEYVERFARKADFAGLLYASKSTIEFFPLACF